MANNLPEQSARVGTVLREVVADHGPEMLSRPELLSNLLADLLPDTPRVARLLVAAAEDQIADLLLGPLATATMFSAEVCSWVASRGDVEGGRPGPA